MPLRAHVVNPLLMSDDAYRTGVAFAMHLDARRLVLGRVPGSICKKYAASFAAGVRDHGTEVLDALVCGTEMTVFGVRYLGADGAAMVRSVESPAGGRPLLLFDGKGRELSITLQHPGVLQLADKPALHAPVNIVGPFVDFVLGHIDASTLRPLKIVVNPLQGSAAPILDMLEAQLPIELVKLNYPSAEPLPDNRRDPGYHLNVAETARSVLDSNADLGVIFSIDYSRCIILDEQGIVLNRTAGAKSTAMSGMIPWLQIAQQISTSGTRLSELSDCRRSEERCADARLHNADVY